MYYNNNNCPQFANWSYNPQYINPQVYVDYQAQIRSYEQQQSLEVMKTANKFREYLNAAEKVDDMHKQELFFACLAVVAEKMNWNR